MTLRPLALAAFLLASPARPADEAAPADPRPGGALRPADGGAADGGEAAMPGGILTISGKIAAVDFARGRFTVEGADGPLELGVDRNTGVFLEKRMGTLRSLAAGLPVRACYAADRRAFWVEVLVKGVLPGRAGLEVKPSAPGSATPPAEGNEEEAIPPGAAAGPPAPEPPAQPGPGRTTPGPKSGG